MSTDVQISEIVRKPELQSRARLDMETVARYTAAMLDKAKFPPVTLYRLPFAFGDGEEGQLVLVHGWHRVAAAEGADKKKIAADIIDGTWDQAVTEASISEDNQGYDTVGLPRSNADKRRQIVMFLSVAANAKKSDNSIAKLLGVNHTTVATVRKELSESLDSVASNQRVDASGRTLNTGNIGKNPSKAHANKRKVDSILNKIDDPDVAQTAMQLAETHAAIEGTEVTPSMLESAVKVAQEVKDTGGLVDLGGEQQVPATAETTVQALQADLAEKDARRTTHMNGDRAIPLQTVYGTVIASGKGKMLLQFDVSTHPELEEKLLEFEAYKKQYAGHVVKVCIYIEDPVKAVHRPSRPVEQPATPAPKPDWERIADGDPDPEPEPAPVTESMPTLTKVAEAPIRKRTRKPKATKTESTTGETPDPQMTAIIAAEPALQDVFANGETPLADSGPDATDLDIF